MSKQLLIFSVVILAGVAGILMLFPREGASGEFDEFAKCLAAKNATMYGADWCPHCQNEKVAFGDAFRLVPYVECPKEPDRCLATGVKKYPTWIFADGRKFEGEQGLEKLSAESGCALR